MTKPEVIPKYKRISKRFVEDHQEQVFKMAQIGCTDKELAHILSMSEENLRINFRTELSEGRARLRRGLRAKQLELALGDKNPTMLIWLGKNYLGQKEPKNEHQHSGGITIEKKIFKASVKKE